MRRNWRRLSVAILVLGAIGLGTTGLFWAATRGPIVSAVMSRLLGRPVEIATISLVPARALEIEVTGVVIRDPDTGEAQIEVPRARARQRWPWLLAGHFFPRQWELDAPVVRLWPERGDERSPLNLSPLDLKVRDGTLELHLSALEIYRVRDLTVDLERSRLRPTALGTASGELLRGEQALGRFDANIEGWLDDANVRVQLDGVDLASVPLNFDGDARGTARGELILHLTNGKVSADIDARVARFSLRVPGLATRVEPRTTRLRGRISWGARGVVLEPQRLQLDDLIVSGRVSIGSGRVPRVRADLRLADFDPGEARVNLITLLGKRFAAWERAHGRIEAGRIADFRVRINLPVARLGESLSFSRRMRPEEFELTAQVHDGVYRTSPDSPPLAGIDGRVQVLGNRLVVSALKMSRGGNPLPVMDLDVDGVNRLTHLPKAERGTPAGPGQPLPGLGAAASSLIRRNESGQEPLRVTLRDLYVGHPALVLPFRDATAELTFPAGKLRVGGARGVYGGVPAELELLYDPKTSHLRADVRFLDGDAEPRGQAGDLWLSAQLSIPALHLGRWRLDDVNANVAAQGALLSFDGGRALFGGGASELRGTVALGSEGFAPVDFYARTVDADAGALNAPLGLPAGSLSGRADYDALIRGRLEPGHSFLEQSDLSIDFHARNGTVANLPASVALARLPSLQGIRGLFGRPLPYDEITARFLLQKGVLRTESLSLTGPELRALAAGELDLLAPDRPADLLLAFLFLQTVDRMIELVPILGNWVLGEDDNLVTMYVRVTGPWANPSASLVPPQSVRTAAGWAERMIGAGVSRLRKILSFPGRKPVPSPTEETDEPPHPS